MSEWSEHPWRYALASAATGPVLTLLLLGEYSAALTAAYLALAVWMWRTHAWASYLSWWMFCLWMIPQTLALRLGAHSDGWMETHWLLVPVSLILLTRATGDAILALVDRNLKLASAIAAVIIVLYVIVHYLLWKRRRTSRP